MPLATPRDAAAKGLAGTETARPGLSTAGRTESCPNGTPWSADLLVVDGHRLDDIAVLEDQGRINLVMCGGRVAVERS